MVMAISSAILHCDELSAVDLATAICIFIVFSKIICILSTWDAVRYSKTAA